MSAIAQPATSVSRPARTRARRHALGGGGVVWILLLGVLLAGVVAVNVVVLQLNVQLDELGRERAELKADAARLRSHLSSASGKARIEKQAAERLGLVAANPEAITHVRIAGESGGP
jgi:cell division protein FtsL